MIKSHKVKLCLEIIQKVISRSSYVPNATRIVRLKNIEKGSSKTHEQYNKECSRTKENLNDS